jgi:hypothetical protein
MITYRSTKLCVPETIYDRRVERLRKMIYLKAPRCVIQLEAELITRCFTVSLTALWDGLWLHYCPHWLQMITSAQYRRYMTEMKYDAE